MPLFLSDELLQALGLDAAAARLALALALFRRGQISLAQACRLAELDEAAFREFLPPEDVPETYGFTEFEEDLVTLAAGETA